MRVSGIVLLHCDNTFSHFFNFQMVFSICIPNGNENLYLSEVLPFHNADPILNNIFLTCLLNTG